MDAVKIKGVVKNYAWGGKDYIPSLLGDYDGKEQAEYWLGTHKSGESKIEGDIPLSSFLGHDLGYLFKVLSIASPLSLQCHPNKAQAEDGWKREEEARKSGAAYNYQDDNEKAEILSSLTPVTAMCGFKGIDDIILSLKKYIPLSCGKYLLGKNTIKEIFLTLFSLSKEDKEAVLEELSKSVENEESREGEFLTSFGIIKETLVKYKGDIGSVFPLMMNVVHLNKEDALFLSPDTLHAYVEGNGIELMTASDNVLRGGLTPKRVDLKELERIMNFTSTEPRKVEKRVEDGIVWYKTPTPEFMLGYVENGRASFNRKGDSIIFSISGETILKEKDESILIKKGESYILSNSSYTIEANGLVYLASCGEE